MSKLPNKTRDKNHKVTNDHQKYISRITKTLYYGKFPKTEDLCLPVTELAAELFSEAQHGRSLNKLHCDDAVKISKNTCVSPCSLVLAILYLERLKNVNCEYLEKVAPADLFLVSLMVSCKFLYDDGETDEVFIDEWAASADMSVKELARLEKQFLNAIDWEVYVNELAFWKKLTDIETTLARRQGNQRGFFTYTEMNNLLATIDLYNFIQCLTTVSLILMASYAAALLSLVGSVLIIGNIPGTYVQTNKTSDNQNLTLLPYIQKPIFNELVDLKRNAIKMANEMKTDFGLENKIRMSNVLETSIFLASIEGFMKPFCNAPNPHNDHNNSQNGSWDWWNVPTMKWLSETTKLVETMEFPVFSLGSVGCYLETYLTKIKHLELEDQINMAAETRIQDQMENSWHKEWTDTINGGFINKYLHYYLQNIKS